MKVRMVWDLPADKGVFCELGKAIYTIARNVSKMDLELADNEGVVFRVEPVELFGIENGGTLRKAIDELAHDLRRVKIYLE